MKKKYNKKRYKEILNKYPLVVKNSDFDARFPTLNEAINKHFGLTFLSSMYIYLLVSFCLTIFCFYLQPNSLVKVSNIFSDNNALIFMLNFIPIFILTSLIGIIFNNPFIACSISSILLFTASLANKYKIAYRDEPFKLSDLSMTKEASSAIFNMNYQVNNALIITLSLTCLIFFICGFIYRVRNKYVKNRIIFASILIISCFILNMTVYNNSYIYDNIISNERTYHETDEFNNKGFVYSFLYSCNNDIIAIPAFYSQDVAISILETNTMNQKQYSFKPNIIYILSEAFMDIDTLENLSFSNEDYPLTNYKQIVKDSIVSGDLIVPNFGGGTSYTEFEVLTGLNTTSLNFTNNPFESVNSNTSSVAKLLKQQGYKNTAIHPGDPWFYKRTAAYDTLGFDTKIFRDDFDQEYSGGNITEKSTFKRLMEEIKTNLNNNEPDFYNMVTIHNHGAYDGKYDDKTYNYSSSTELSELAQDITKNYLINLKELDTELKNLTDYLNSINEPFVIVYYGDHLPFLGSDYLVFKQAGWDLSNMNSAETTLKIHTTPYFIWANNVAKNSINKSFIKNNNVSNIPISSNYISTLLFETIGFNDISSYFTYSKDLFGFINVYYKGIIMKDNTILNNVDEIVDDVISKWKIIEYYFIQEQEEVT